MSRLPKVSIVIPTFNQGQYLPASVTHCLFQTYENLEIIIVDGGSTDSTKEYLAGLEQEIKEKTMLPVACMSEEGEIVRKEIRIYPQNRELKVISFDRDIGATRTYNEGLKRASGKYCTYVVGDDMPHPHMIEEMVTALEAGKGDFIYSDMNLVDDDNLIVRQMQFPDFDFKTCLADWFHLGVSKLYRTELHDTVGLMDENYTAANDYDQYLRFAMMGCRFYHLPRLLYSVRWHGPNRRVGQHTSERYEILMEESKKCAVRAREFYKNTEIQ